ncbi:hypothetical protein B7494_g8294 [Chlorociboria aeruginascens]|nr:hypothetical protein B7494_g8294 [Chlorociboria aeruginascens]
MAYCCVCGLNIGGIYYPETFDLDDEEIAQLYNKDELPEWQLEVEMKISPISRQTGYIRVASFTTLEGKQIAIINCEPGFDSDSLLPDITAPDSFFPVHLNCLSIVDHIVARRLSTLSNEPMTSLANIQHFYQILDQLRPLIRENPDGVVGKGIEWAHGYYGARRFWFDSWTMECGWEFLCADPFNIPTLMEYLLSNLQQIPVPRDAPLTLSIPSQRMLGKVPYPAIDALPAEVLNKIVSHLPISSILSLHRTNRALFNRISLNQTFWRDQLTSNNLVSFLWDLDAVACREKDSTMLGNTGWDWKTLARNLRDEPFVELALKHRLAQPLAIDIGRGHLGFWGDFSENAKSKLKGSPPLGLINRVRIVRVIAQAMLMEGKT